MKALAAPRAIELLYGLIGLWLIAWALIQLPSDWYLIALLLICAVAVLTPYSIRLNDPVRLPGAMPLEVAVLLLAPPPVAILVAACTNLFTSIRYRRPLSRTLFNVGNLALPNALAAATLTFMLDPWPRPLRAPDDLPAIALAVAVRMVANLLGTAMIQYAEQKIPRFWVWVGRSLSEEWRAGGFGMRILPVLMAFAFPVAGWWALALGAILQFAIGGSMQRYQDRIEEQSLVDGLTGLGTRKAWEEYATGPYATAAHSVAVIDVDGLKRTNDTYGHRQGDAILVDLAQRFRFLNDQFPDSRAFRVGGDEFVVIHSNPQQTDEFRSAMEQSIAEYRRHWRLQTIPASASVGFAGSPTEVADLISAFALADRRMYQGKPRELGHSIQ